PLRMDDGEPWKTREPQRGLTPLSDAADYLEPGDFERAPLRRLAYGLIIALAAGVHLAAILRVEPLLSANDRSRWATVRALVENGTYRINDVIADRGWDTIDKVRTAPELFRDDFAEAFVNPGWETSVSREALAGDVLHLETPPAPRRDVEPAEAALVLPLDVRGDFAVELKFDDYLPSLNSSFELRIVGSEGCEISLMRRSLPRGGDVAVHVTEDATGEQLDSGRFDRGEGFLKLEYNAARERFRAYVKMRPEDDYREMPDSPYTCALGGGEPRLLLVLRNNSPEDAAAVDVDWVRVLGSYEFYSTKPPLLATLVAGVYGPLRFITGWTLAEDTAEVTRVVLVIVNLLPFLAMLWVLARLAERYIAGDFGRVFVVAALAFGTFLSTFSVTLNNHAPAAAAVAFALYSALRITVDGSRRMRHFVLCGFFAALAATMELPAAAFGVALFGLLAWHDWKRTLAVFVPAALVPLAAFFYTNWLATGGWKPFYAYYGTEAYRYVHEGVASYWINPKGLDANVESPVTYFLNCTVGHHGILSLSPMFALTVAAWVMLPRRRGHRLVTTAWLALAMTVLVLGFYLTRTENYNYGGHTAGLRWAFWLIPLLLAAMGPALDAWSLRPAFRRLAAVLLAISCFSAWYAIDNPWQHPWLYELFH
ncbi:MAG: DUF2029 domain-containing protein, partial [Planctomycetes bacterium]|nr:DUF2029 domain-containing protein [Planctomycetota bacterium]